MYVNKNINPLVRHKCNRRMGVDSNVRMNNISIDSKYTVQFITINEIHQVFAYNINDLKVQSRKSMILLVKSLHIKVYLCTCNDIISFKIKQSSIRSRA